MEICPKSRGRLYNTRTGDNFWAGCRTYKCPVCGPRKVRRFKRAVQEWLKQFEYVRIWTFTLSSKLFDTPVEHFRILQEAYRRTIKDIRRIKNTTTKQKHIHYIAIRELHQSGFTHLHVLVTAYIQVQLVQEIYDFHVRNLLASRGGLPDKVCNVHIEGVWSKKGVVNYITKYLTKALHQEGTPYTIRYTKSHFVLFPVTKGRDCWIFMRESPPILDTYSDSCSRIFSCSEAYDVILSTFQVKKEQNRGSP